MVSFVSSSNRITSNRYFLETCTFVQHKMIRIGRWFSVGLALLLEAANPLCNGGNPKPPRKNHCEETRGSLTSQRRLYHTNPTSNNATIPSRILVLSSSGKEAKTLLQHTFRSVYVREILCKFLQSGIWDPVLAKRYCHSDRAENRLRL